MVSMTCHLRRAYISAANGLNVLSNYKCMLVKISHILKPNYSYFKAEKVSFNSSSLDMGECRAETSKLKAD